MEIITRKEFNKEIDRFILETRIDVEDAMMNLSDDPLVAYAQIVAPTGLMHRLNTYTNNIAQQQADKLVRREEEVVYVKEGDTLKRMARYKFERSCEEQELSFELKVSGQTEYDNERDKDVV